GRLVRGDLGQSIFLRKPVTEAILDRVEPTLLLTLFATLISVVIGVAGGWGRGPRGQLFFCRKPVTEAILDRVEPTLLLTLFATLISVVIGVPAGVTSARYHNSATDENSP